jgi:hypothetical protein
MNFINFNKIDDDCGNKIIEKNNNVLIGIDKISSISLILYSNFTHLNKVHSLYQSEGVHKNIYIYIYIYAFIYIYIYIYFVIDAILIIELVV